MARRAPQGRRATATRSRAERGLGKELDYIYYPLSGGGGERSYSFCYVDGR